MKKPSLEKEERLSFNKIEILIMVVLVALIIVSLTLVVSITTRNKRVSNFKTDAEYIGFCHYRRFFDIPDGEKLDKNVIYANSLQVKCSNSTYFLLTHDPKVPEKFTEFLQKYIRTRTNAILEYSLMCKFLDLNFFYSAIIFNMIIPFPNYQDRSYGFILERMSAYALFKMQALDKNLDIKQGKYLNLDNAPTWTFSS